MVNYKSLYLEYKLKYINAKNQKQYGGFGKIRQIYELIIPQSTPYNKITLINKFKNMEIQANKLLKKNREQINDWKYNNLIKDNYSKVPGHVVDHYSKVDIDIVDRFFEFLYTLWTNRNENIDTNATTYITNNCNHCNEEICICPDCKNCKEKERDCKCIISYPGDIEDEEYIHFEENPDIYPLCFSCGKRVGLNCSC
jgi:hypothetical protein